MRRSDIIFTTSLIPIDYAALVAAATAAYFLRFAEFVQRIRPVIFTLPFREYFPITLLITAGWIIIFAFSGLYTIRKERKIVPDLTRVVLGCSTGTLVVVLVFFFSRELFSSRFMLLAAWLLSIVFVMTGRILMRFVRRATWKRGKGIHNVALIGSEEKAQTILSSPFGNIISGHRIVCRVASWGEEGKRALNEQLQQATGGIDELILTDAATSSGSLREMVDFCTAHQITFKYSAELLGGGSANLGVDMIAGIPIIELRTTRLDGWGRVWKRLFDVALSCIGLLFLFPIAIIVGIAIKLDSRGPVFVSLARIGAKGKRFSLYKFRSMVTGAERMKRELLQYNERADGPLFKMAHDPRITRLGKWLRTTSVDELPQLWNVFKGDMSLVGPRPHEPQEVEKYHTEDRQLLLIRPGITGMAQVSGRTNLTFEEEARIDRFYIQQWSLLLDLVILLKTPFVLVRNRGV